MYHNFIKHQDRHILDEYETTRNRLTWDLKKAREVSDQNKILGVSNELTKMLETVNPLKGVKERSKLRVNTIPDRTQIRDEDLGNVMN